MRKRSSRIFEQNRRTPLRQENVRRNKFASRFVKADEDELLAFKETLDEDEADHMESFDEDLSEFEDLDLADFEDDDDDDSSYDYHDDEEDMVPADYEGELDDIGTSPLDMPEVDMMDTKEKMDPLTNASRNIRKLARALTVLSAQVDMLQEKRKKQAARNNKNISSRRTNRKVR